MTENTPDAARLATGFARRLRANADRAEKDKFTVANLSTMSVDGCRALADWIDDAAEFLGARAMQAAMAAPAGVRLEKRPAAFLIEGRDWGVEVVLAEERAQTVCERVPGTEYHGLYRRDGRPAIEDAVAQEGAASHSLTVNTEAGFSEFVVGDPATVTQELPGGCALLLDVESREVVGFRWPLATPAPDVPGLVKRARHREDNITRCLREFSWRPSRAGIEGARNCIRELAAALEALQAEVEGWRKATWEAREGIARRDERLPLLMNGWTARATTAEAERDALKAEVERLRVIVGRFCQANDEGKLCDDIDNDGSHYPSQFLDDTLNMAAAALAPAKAGG